VLTRVALCTSTSRSDASTVLRITMSFLQGVGSLRVFRADSTLAYQNVMGWTDVVSASPLSVGFLECVMRLPYLVQYVATVSLPVLAAACVVAIFLLASTLRAVHCRPSCGFAYADWRAAIVTWWRDRRATATTLFVLFLAYMPITSASLRALDCTDAVDGVRYLRTNLSVECHVGQHAAARVLAYVVLVVVGIGFPAGLAWMLGTATNAQLSDAAFHAAWGFLFDGYKAPAVGGGVITGHASGATKRGSCAAAAGKVSPGSTGTAIGGTNTRQRRRSSIIDSATAQRLVQPWQMTGQNRVWWEAVVLLRKAGVVLLAVLVANPYLQCVGATLWFGGFLLLQVKYTPYTRLLFNRLELASLTASVLTAIISTALLQYNVGVATAELHGAAAMTSIEWAVTLLLAFLNMGTFLVCAGVWVWLQCRRVNNVARRVSLNIRRRTSRAGSIVAAWSGHRKSVVSANDGVANLPVGTTTVSATGTTATSSNTKDTIVLSHNPLRAVPDVVTDTPAAVDAVALAPPLSVLLPSSDGLRMGPRPAMQRLSLLPHAVRGTIIWSVRARLPQLLTSTTPPPFCVQPVDPLRQPHWTPS